MAVIDGTGILANQIEATTSKGLLSLGPGPWDGSATGAFKGSALGTVLGINVPKSFAGDLEHFQAAGADLFKIDANGAVWQPNASGLLVKIPRWEEVTLPLLAATVSQTIFIADDSYIVTGVQVVANVVGGSGATVTLEVNTGTQAPGSGTAQTAAQDLHGITANTSTTVAVTTQTTMVAGNRLGIVMAGTLTGLVGNLTVQLQRV